MKHRGSERRRSLELRSVLLPRGLRGLYVLYKYKRRNDKCDVVYVGMTNSSGGGVRSRLMRHRDKKRELWTHAYVFVVWENIRDEEVTELEGLFRHIYRYDSRANILNKQRGFRRLREVRDDDIELW